MQKLKPDILENLTEYDLEAIVNALVALYGTVRIADLLLPYLQRPHQTALKNQPDPGTGARAGCR